MLVGSLYGFFKMLKRIVKLNCKHYCRYDWYKFIVFRRKKYIIECIDCGKRLKYDDEKSALLEIENSQNMHGYNYKILRNGLMKGEIDIVRLNIGK